MKRSYIHSFPGGGISAIVAMTYVLFAHEPMHDRFPGASGAGRMNDGHQTLFWCSKDTGAVVISHAQKFHVRFGICGFGLPIDTPVYYRLTIESVQAPSVLVNDTVSIDLPVSVDSLFFEYPLSVSMIPQDSLELVCRVWLNAGDSLPVDSVERTFTAVTEDWHLYRRWCTSPTAALRIHHADAYLDAVRKGLIAGCHTEQITAEIGSLVMDSLGRKPDSGLLHWYTERICAEDDSCRNAAQQWYKAKTADILARKRARRRLEDSLWTTISTGCDEISLERYIQVFSKPKGRRFDSVMTLKPEIDALARARQANSAIAYLSCADSFSRGRCMRTALESLTLERWAAMGCDTDRQWIRVGKLMMLYGRYDRARVCFQKATRAAPDRPAAYEQLYNLYAKYGKIVASTGCPRDSADKYLRRAIDCRSSSYVIYHDAAIQAFGKGGSHAMSNINKSLALNPRCAACYLARGRLNALSGAAAAAEADFKKTITLDPHSREADEARIELGEKPGALK